MDSTLCRIVSPHFVAGIEASDGKVAMAAPILNYMMGWTGRQVADYCKEKGWQWERVTPAPKRRQVRVEGPLSPGCNLATVDGSLAFVCVRRGKRR